MRKVDYLILVALLLLQTLPMLSQADHVFKLSKENGHFFTMPTVFNFDNHKMYLLSEQ